MNEMTRLSAKGHVVIPRETLDRLNLSIGTEFEVSDIDGKIMLNPTKRSNPFPRTTLEDIMSIPRWTGEPKSIDEISRLSDETLREIFAEQERNARD